MGKGRRRSREQKKVKENGRRRKGLANTVPRKRRVKFPELGNIQSNTKNLLKQVAYGERLKVVNDLMVDDDVEVGKEVNFNAISSNYGGDLLEIEESKNGDEKVDDVEKDGVEKESEEEQAQVAEEEDSEPPTVVVYYNNKKDEVAKTEIVFFNQEEVVGEAYQASADQTTTVSVEEQTIESKESKEEVEQNKEEVVENKDDDDGNSQNKPDPEQVIKEMAVDQTNFVLMESEVDVILKKRHALTEEEINERAFKMACQMN
ncbi:hypothetical protein GIB67_001464 [Kingdonia uniflora]|uniref:Uncharacterized protein n=1 Tax=Kingdonia uniflora TaxID=39325 RepID=A0A7J7L6W2_9MAGN|nr:hypothetical protein GIB67_001464 [Kingdonia uniflora]